MSTETGTKPVIRYAGYDKKSGKIVHMHSRFSVAENRFVEMPIDELIARFSRDASVVAKLSDGDAGNLDFLQVVMQHEGERLGPTLVDPVQRRLVHRPALVLSADRREITGDGQDFATITVAVHDAHGQVVGGATGLVKVTTERGRLSDRGGVVTLVSGRATTTLTAANETAHRVRVSARSLQGPMSPGHIDLEFT
jgi:hypothetical protein